MRLSKILSSLFVIAYVVAVPTVQNDEEKFKTNEDDERMNYPIQNIPEGFGKDKPIPIEDTDCFSILRGVECMDGMKRNLRSDKDRINVCKNNNCQKCIEDTKYCMECSKYLRNNYGFRGCNDIKVDRKWRIDRHL